jgi:hypothetical protein
VYQGGDTDGDGKLDPGEVWTYQATGTAVAGQYANLGTATGTWGNTQVSDEDPSHYVGVLSSVGDYVWWDADADGIQEEDEPGLPNVTVELYTSAGVLSGTTATDANGKYGFTGLNAGNYYIKFIKPAGFARISPQDQGSDDALDSDANQSGQTAVFALGLGETKTTIDAGMYKKISSILECVTENGDGTYTAYFGYRNDNPKTIHIAAGSNNKFTPGPEDRGQPTDFAPGRTPYDQNAPLQIVFNGSNLVWTLDGGTSTASSNSKRCPIPDIEIEKATNGEDADNAPGPSIPVGGAVT